MTVTVGRRTFVAGLGSAAVACSFAARAQEPGRIYRIGFLIPTPRDRPAVAALFDELRLHGFVEHQNLEVLPGGFGVRNEEPRTWRCHLRVDLRSSPAWMPAWIPRSTRALPKVTPM